MAAVDFRGLIAAAQREGRAVHLRPRPVGQIARRLGMSRAHLYNLMNGTKAAPEWTVHRIAKALDLGADVVQRALDLSQAGALER